jgi:hypothetical protein
MKDQNKTINGIAARIENDFSSFTDERIEYFFSQYFTKKKDKKFILFYNRIVIDKEPFSFGEFNYLWAIRMSTKARAIFDENYAELKKEIIEQKNIRSFYEKYCCQERKEAIFCCKLFHCVLPNEFIPVDNNIIAYFAHHTGLNPHDKIAAHSLIQAGYTAFLANHKDSIAKVKQTLSDSKYEFFRFNESSDFRILDLIYWKIAGDFKEK